MESVIGRRLNTDDVQKSGDRTFSFPSSVH
jgi:hypothetical protein